MGSTSNITDASGEVYQHLEYFAFGEIEERRFVNSLKNKHNSEQTFVEEHSNTNRTPYLFNGKELDDETGLYYYGARYYDALTSIFLSVDPLAEKFVFQSAYAYAANNPVRFVDVLGMGPGDPNSPQKTGGNTASNVKAKNPVIEVGKKIVQDLSNDAKAVGEALSDAGKSISGFVKPKIQFAIYGSGGAPVVKGNEASDDKVTIPVNLEDLPSPQGGGLKAESSLGGLMSDFAEFLGFTKKAVDKVEEIQNKPESTWQDSKNYDGLEYNTQRTHNDSVTYKNDNSTTKTIHQKQVYEKKEIVFD